MFNPKLEYFACFLLFLNTMILITILLKDKKKKRKHHHRKFSLTVLFKKQNKLTMAINATTLTNTTPVTGDIVLQDEFGNEYTGSLSNPQLGVADPALDDATIDPANPDKLIVTAKGPDGIDTATLKGDWISQGNTTSRPNPDSSKPASKAIPDGQIISGVTASISITNDITRQFVLAVKFP